MPTDASTAIVAGQPAFPSGTRPGRSARDKPVLRRRGAPMAKQGKNEGSIYERKDGRWAAAVTVDGGTRKTVHGAPRAEVQQKLVRLQRERQRGTPLVDERDTVATFLDRWLETSV